MMSKVFISYSSKNRSVVKMLADDLKALGHSPWHDQDLEGGQSWWDTILKEILHCEVFIFALSPDSLESFACSLEYKYAYALKKRILPVLIAGDVSQSMLPLELTMLQFVDYRENNRNSILSLQDAFANLPPSQALPEPLPAQPKVPISKIVGLREQVTSPNNISYEQQSILFFRIKEELNNPNYRQDAAELLRLFRQRPDVALTVVQEIDESLAPFKPKASSQPNSPQATASPFTWVFMLIVLVVLAIAAFVFVPPLLQTASLSTETATTAAPTATDRPTEAATTVLPSATDEPTQVPTTVVPSATDSPTATPTTKPSDTASPTETATTAPSATDRPSATPTTRPTNTPIPTETATTVLPTATTAPSLEPTIAPTLAIARGDVLFVAENSFLRIGAGIINNTDLPITLGTSVRVVAAVVPRGEDRWVKVESYWGGGSGWISASILQPLNGALAMIVRPESLVTMGTSRCNPAIFGCDARPIYEAFQVPVDTQLTIDCYAFRNNRGYYRATPSDRPTAYLHAQSSLEDSNGQAFTLQGNAAIYEDGQIHMLPNCP